MSGCLKFLVCVVEECLVETSSTIKTATKLGPHTQTDQETCPGVGLRLRLVGYLASVQMKLVIFTLSAHLPSVLQVHGVKKKAQHANETRTLPRNAAWHHD